MEKGKRGFPQRNKGPPLDKVEADVAHRQKAVYKGKRVTLVLMRWYVLVGHVH